MTTVQLKFILDPVPGFEDDEEAGNRYPFPYLSNNLIVEGSNLYPDTGDLLGDSSRILDENPDIVVKTQDTFDCSNSIIYRASLNQGTNVILKFALGDAQISLLLRQAGLYWNELKNLQGSVIPELHGVLKGTLFSNRDEGQKDAKEFVCLVLQDCGEPVTANFNFFDEIPMDERCGILEMLSQFHKQGLHPKEFFEDHILKGADGKWRMVGFHNIICHECAFKNWSFGETVKEIGCDILYSIGTDFCIWDHWGIPFIDIGGIKYNGTHYPSQEIVDALTKGNAASSMNRTILLAWLKDIKLFINESQLGEPDKATILKQAQNIRPVFQD